MELNVTPYKNNPPFVGQVLSSAKKQFFFERAHVFI